MSESPRTRSLAVTSSQVELRVDLLLDTLEKYTTQYPDSALAKQLIDTAKSMKTTAHKLLSE